MFLLYINDIGTNITNSKVKLFADDCLLYRIVDSKEDESKLQDDLTELQNWADKWQMSFNTKKCHLLSVQKKGHHVNSQYKLYGNILEIVEHHPYLGVELQLNLKWDHHIKQITGKATRSLAFLRRNLSRCPEQTKEGAYAALVGPHVEFASAMWDRHLKKDIKEVEKIQRRAARFVRGVYKREDGIVTQLLNELERPCLRNEKEIASTGITTCIPTWQKSGNCNPPTS